ncbi:MAG: deoxyribose-phosphate aldolase [Tetragenococcus koreensis]|nr:deoxyribose-phosphate aldolase [Tetragenococcus koreensis]MDN6749877.1 deoxyribose-phosphate aldolase [Staphylococcus equorum]MDN6146187.1 deoxyribose-phosphate aldolase [Tetragenococcus koreensis]MDN6266632.1 deoxyribose-phosphate aldolase [Tetragenococcus koreensis]MDN6579664.1 deoxyribose-phosphate aldolase [Tetragenococcus koreensis]
MKNLTNAELAKKIQHTNVNPELSKDDIIGLCEDCLTYGFDGVMLQPAWITTAREILKDSDVKVCTALGYPMGGATTESKVFEAKNCFELGADQLDFMANIGYIKSGMYTEYRDQIAAVVNAANGKVTKIMLEFGMLDHEEKIKAAELAIEAGITYVKNSSGWGKGGKATVEDIKLLKQVAGDKALVKASGGVRNREQAIIMLNAGASLLGTSAGIAILTGTGSGLSDY